MNPPDASVATPAATPRIIPRSEHAISRSRISPNALRVLYRLRDGGFMAFLVGGCVRDLLLGLEQTKRLEFLKQWQTALARK